MAWKSDTFKAGGSAGNEAGTRNPAAEIAARHRDAMDEVIRQARDYASERRHILDSIRDPALRRSAGL